MNTQEATLKKVDLKTRVHVRRDSNGRSRTTHRRTYTLELDDGSTVYYLGDGSFKAKDKLVFVSRQNKEEKTVILAYKNLTQNEQKPTGGYIRNGFLLSALTIGLGLLILWGGLPIRTTEQQNIMIFAGICFMLYGVYMAKPSLESNLALRQLKAHLEEQD